jgi:hypothetical protein
MTTPAHEELRRIAEALEAELRLWRLLVIEGGVPRYTVTPGAALNSVVTSTDALLRRARSILHGGNHDQ